MFNERILSLLPNQSNLNRTSILQRQLPSERGFEGLQHNNFNMGSALFEESVHRGQMMSNSDILNHAPSILESVKNPSFGGMLRHTARAQSQDVTGQVLSQISPSDAIEATKRQAILHHLDASRNINDNFTTNSNDALIGMTVHDPLFSSLPSTTTAQTLEESQLLSRLSAQERQMMSVQAHSLLSRPQYNNAMPQVMHDIRLREHPCSDLGGRIQPRKQLSFPNAFPRYSHGLVSHEHQTLPDNLTANEQASLSHLVSSRGLYSQQRQLIGNGIQPQNYSGLNSGIEHNLMIRAAHLERHLQKIEMENLQYEMNVRDQLIFEREQDALAHRQLLQSDLTNFSALDNLRRNPIIDKNPMHHPDAHIKINHADRAWPELNSNQLGTIYCQEPKNQKYPAVGPMDMSIKSHVKAQTSDLTSSDESFNHSTSSSESRHAKYLEDNLAPLTKTTQRSADHIGSIGGTIESHFHVKSPYVIEKKAEESCHTKLLCDLQEFNANTKRRIDQAPQALSQVSTPNSDEIEHNRFTTESMEKKIRAMEPPSVYQSSSCDVITQPLDLTESSELHVPKKKRTRSDDKMNLTGVLISRDNVPVHDETSNDVDSASQHMNKKQNTFVQLPLFPSFMMSSKDDHSIKDNVATMQNISGDVVSSCDETLSKDSALTPILSLDCAEDGLFSFIQNNMPEMAKKLRSIRKKHIKKCRASKSLGLRTSKDYDKTASMSHERSVDKESSVNFDIIDIILSELKKIEHSSSHDKCSKAAYCIKSIEEMRGGLSADEVEEPIITDQNAHL